MTLRFRGRAADPSAGGLIVGIVNVTPDSFSDGGTTLDKEAAVRHGLRLLSEGADILDIGAESTRPGALPVPVEEEMRRLLPVVEGLRHVTAAPISVDTSKAAVAEAALAAGADIINDVTALGDPGMGAVVAAAGAGLILMHMKGVPRTMQDDPSYEAGVAGEVAKFLSERRKAALACGVPPEALILDPGLGFGKTAAHNLALLRAVSELCRLGAPLMIGHSRKSFLGSFAGGGESRPGFAERLAPAVALTALARRAGAGLFRVHDPAPHRAALRAAEAMDEKGVPA